MEQDKKMLGIVGCARWSAVGFAAMSNFVNHNRFGFLVDGVQNSIISFSDAKSVSHRYKFFRLRGTRIARQTFNSFLKCGNDSGRDALPILGSGRRVVNAIQGSLFLSCGGPFPLESISRGDERGWTEHRACLPRTEGISYSLLGLAQRPLGGHLNQQDTDLLGISSIFSCEERLARKGDEVKMGMEGK